MKVSVTVDIPDDCEVTGDTTLQAAAWDSPANQIPKQGRMVFAVQVREKWQWPSWLLVDWVGRCRDGLLAIGFGNPVTDGGSFKSERGSQFYWLVDESMIAINLPPCTDWRQSLRLNPNREAKP